MTTVSILKEKTQTIHQSGTRATAKVRGAMSKVSAVMSQCCRTDVKVLSKVIKKRTKQRCERDKQLFFEV